MEKESWAKVAFDVSSRILGADIELSDGGTERLAAKRVEEKLFREVRTGRAFTTRQMISVLLEKTNVRKQDLVRPGAIAEAFEKGVSVGKPSLDLSFTPGSFEFILGREARDITRIIFDVELTVRPKKHG